MESQQVMFIIFEDRPSDSPYVERIWRSHSERADTFCSVATPHWEMVVSKHKGETSFIVRGPETRATLVECPSDGEWFAIRFKLGTFMPLLPTADRRDRKDIVLPDASTRSFWLNGSAWEYPGFENAETFVKRLVARGLVDVDPQVMSSPADARQDVSERTTQRRYIRTTGLTRSTIDQIERARRSALLLRNGQSIHDVIFETGYYDQAHLTRSLKHFIGLTPGQIARADRQLSFLYKTDSD
jgi:hypothetical protein